MTAFVRKIGTGICFTFPNGNFSMWKGQEAEQIPENILNAIEQNGSYEGPIPDAIYFAYLVCESEYAS